MAIRPQGRKRTLSKKVSSFNMYMGQVYQFRAIMESTAATKDAPVIRVLLDEALGARRRKALGFKHWRAGKRVGHSTIKSFLNVVVRESRQGGLFLSTSGYSDKALKMLSEMEQERLKFGSEEKMVNLFETYVKIDSGIWSPPELLTEVLFEGTQ